MEIIKTRRSIDDSENKYRVKYKDGEHIGYEIVKYDELENYTLEKKEKVENDIKKYPQLKQYIIYRNEEQGESIVFFEEILTEILF